MSFIKSYISRIFMALGAEIRNGKQQYVVLDGMTWMPSTVCECRITGSHVLPMERSVNPRISVL